MSCVFSNDVISVNDVIVAIWIGVGISIILIALVMIVVQEVGDWLRNRGG